MVRSPEPTRTILPSTSPWSKFEPKDEPRPQPQRMAFQRCVTLIFGSFETVLKLPNTLADLDAIAREWTKIPPDAEFILRIPIEYASLYACRTVSGPYVDLRNEATYQMATMGNDVLKFRVEIVSYAPPPRDEPPPPP